MIKFNSIKNYFVPRIRLARMDFKRTINDSKDIIREDNVFKRISTGVKELYGDITTLYTRGEVHTSGVTDDKAKAMLDTSKPGLKAYAKANNIDIIFHTPQKPYECGSNAYFNPLTVTVDSKNGVYGSYKVEQKTINGDTNELTKYVTEKKVKSGDRFITSTYEGDETFLRRVYRTVSDLKNNIEQRNK